MKLAQGIKVLFLSIASWGLLSPWMFWGVRQPSLLFLMAQPEYRSVLEEREKGGQEKAPGISSFLAPELVLSSDMDEIASWIRSRTDREAWPESHVQDMAQYIALMSYGHRLQPGLVLSVIEVESSFQRDARSHRGALGLMQLMPGTAEEIASRKGLAWSGPETLVDPKRNIEFGIHYIGDLRKRFQRTDYILAAYNIGPTALVRRLRQGEAIPTSFYHKVMGTMSKFQQRTPVAASVPGWGKWL